MTVVGHVDGRSETSSVISSASLESEEERWKCKLAWQCLKMEDVGPGTRTPSIGKDVEDYAMHLVVTQVVNSVGMFIPLLRQAESNPIGQDHFLDSGE